ncbi:MAG: tetratricopeptide repeat protein [Hyphomicrobiales bacterium]|nr:tetratricopeptide repeat protein [Hyphomicrobiales bacterium]
MSFRWRSNNCPSVYYLSGRLREAEQYFRRAIAISTRSTGSESSDVANLLSHLVLVLRDEGRLDEARTLAERSLAINEKVHGPAALRTGVAVATLASVFAGQRRHPEAKALYAKASTILDASAGRRSLHTNMTIRDLAAVECALGEFDASLGHAREAARFLSDRAARTGAREAGVQAGYTIGVFPALVCAALGAARERPQLREMLASEALIEALSRTDGGKAEADGIRSQRAQLERQLSETVIAIERASPDFAALTNSKPIDLAQVRGHLADDEALIVHMVTQTATYVWAISRTDLAWERIPLGTAELTQKVAAFRRPLDEWARTPRGLDQKAKPVLLVARPIRAVSPVLMPVARTIAASASRVPMKPTQPCSDRWSQSSPDPAPTNV